MQIKKNAGALIITFRYEPKILNVVRDIDGRTFNPRMKQWEVPIENAVDCLDKLLPLGFHLGAGVAEEYTRRKAEIDRIADIKATPQPYSGSLPLYDFQRTGAAVIAGFPAFLLADEPGLGKTLQVLAGTEGIYSNRLVLCPASLKYNWRDEILKWHPGASVIVIDGKADVRAEDWRKNPGWTIANYELLLRDMDSIRAHAELHGPWNAVICDEADRISNPLAKTTKAVKSLPALKKVAMTGTPISNAPDDLWSIVDWLYPGILGSFFAFQKKYCKLDPQYRRVIGYMNLDQLREKVEPMLLRRMKDDVLTDFPEKTVQYVRFELSKKEKDLYDAVKKSVLDDIKKLSDMDTKNLAIIPVKMLRLKQATDHPALVQADDIESTKLGVLKDLLKPIIASGEKAIVFTQFSTMAQKLWSELKEHNPLLITGDVKSEERMDFVNLFMNSSDHKVMIMTEAGSSGLNLQVASYIVHYDAPWSVGKLEQREGRAHRIGQSKPVTVYHLVARRTIDEYVLKVLSGKRKMSGDILGDNDEPESVESILEFIEGEQ